MFQDLCKGVPAFILIPQMVAHADLIQGKIDIAGAKAKFATGYNADKYRDAITDGDILKRLDALDPLSQLVVAQSFLRGWRHGRLQEIHQERLRHPASDPPLLLLRGCARGADNSATVKRTYSMIEHRWISSSGAPTR